VAKVGNRFAALQPAYDAVINRFGGLGPDIARGIKLRHDWAAIVGPTISRVRSPGSASRNDAAFVGEPMAAGWPNASCAPSRSSSCGPSYSKTSTNCAQGVAAFIEPYNEEWLIERLGHRTPTRGVRDATAAVAA
jgi:putative transposase